VGAERVQDGGQANAFVCSEINIERDEVGHGAPPVACWQIVAPTPRAIPPGIDLRSRLTSSDASVPGGAVVSRQGRTPRFAADDK